MSWMFLFTQNRWGSWESILQMQIRAVEVWTSRVVLMGVSAKTSCCPLTLMKWRHTWSLSCGFWRSSSPMWMADRLRLRSLIYGYLSLFIYDVCQSPHPWKSRARSDSDINLSPLDKLIIQLNKRETFQPELLDNPSKFESVHQNFLS